LPTPAIAVASAVGSLRPSNVKPDELVSDLKRAQLCERLDRTCKLRCGPMLSNVYLDGGFDAP
jgi:hypothetical protein